MAPCRPSGWLYSHVHMKNISSKQSHNFQIVIDLIEFSEN